MEKKNGVSSPVVLEDKILRSPRCAIEIPEISLPELIYSSLKEHEDRPVLIAHDNSRSYTARQIDFYGGRVASALIRRGLKPGDVFCLCSANNLDVRIVVLGAISAGAVITLAKPNDTIEDLHKKIELAGAVYVVVEEKNSGKAREATLNLSNFRDILVFGKTDGCISFAELLEDDGCAYTGPPKINPRETPLVIAFSSGTTGTPKAIVHTHYSVLAIYYQGNHSEQYLNWLASTV